MLKTKIEIERVSNGYIVHFDSYIRGTEVYRKFTEVIKELKDYFDEDD